MQDNIYSYHTFMLPFTYKEKDKKELLKEWTLSSYDIGYNENAYFHDFFRESMLRATYYVKEFSNKEFIVCKSKEYELVLDSANIRLFEDLQVGILTLNIKNTKYEDIKSILEINDYTRRLYPEYLDFEECKSGLVPEYVEFNGVRESFEFDKDLKEPKISKIINEFIPTDKIKKAVDDRMFTISYYKNPSLVKELMDGYESNDAWYKYIFVDGDGLTVQNIEMQRELTKEATYARWQNDGTMYGVSRYSFVCLAQNEFPLSHMQTMYQSMFSNLLMVRATLLKFSKEVSDASNSDISKEISKLYKNYISFVNRFYFREITAKDQGLELYEKALDILNIQRDIKDLDKEIEELFKYAEMQTEKKSADAINTLTWIGGILLPPSILTGYFGMNTLSQSHKEFEYSLELIILSAFVVPVAIAIKNLIYKGDS